MTSERWTTSNKAVFDIVYHLVWCSKYRRKVLVGNIEIRLKELLLMKANEIGVIIDSMVITPDQVHLSVRSSPVLSPHYVVQQLKAYTSHELREEYPELRTRLPTLWTRYYYCVSVGQISDEVIAHYIELQKKQ